LASNKVESTVTSQLVEYLKATPQAIAVVFFAFLEGHLWVFMITAYVRDKTKGNKLIMSVAGKVTIGLLWITLNMVIIYAIQYQSWPMKYENILEIVVPTIVLSLLLQLLIFLGCLKYGDRP
jgi:hypothetical protein